MTVRAKYKINDEQILKMDLTITFTMTVENWRALNRLIPATHPGWPFSDVICTAIGDISRATERTYMIPLTPTTPPEGTTPSPTSMTDSSSQAP